MLMPKRVKRRRVHRGRMTGVATRGNKLAYGEFGLVTTEPCWIKSNQIEAARIAMTRYTKRGGQVWIKIFQINLLLKNLLKQEWVVVKVHQNSGLLLLNQAEFYSNLLAFQKQQREMH